MAKQTFSVGQTLTAAQMISLQQTAMLGGAASAKTASYTLVAADAGTAISMDNVSATTITVNTALFAAGDTVQITNLGAGVCTITAGTATVNTSSSLALAQYESGTLDFTSTSAAIFIKGAGAAATSGGMTLISTTTLSGATTTLSSIPQTYNSLYLVIDNALPASDGQELRMRFNGDSGANRHCSAYNQTFSNAAQTFDTTYQRITVNNDNAVSTAFCTIEIPNYTNTTSWKFAKIIGVNNDETTTTSIRINQATGPYNQTAAISSLAFFFGSGNATSGTIKLYGVK
jgi:hypothetical protein